MEEFIGDAPQTVSEERVSVLANHFMRLYSSTGIVNEDVLFVGREQDMTRFLAACACVLFLGVVSRALIYSAQR